MNRQIFHRTVTVDNVEIFYREAGDNRKPSILLLHGFPSSSVMFKNLMVVLSDRFHLVAPDYPGFGFSDFPDRKYFRYTFDNIAGCIYKFTEAIGLESFSIYLHDYGCPIGLRLCLRNPKRIERLIIQNGNAYMEGIGPQWDETRDYWANPTEEKKQRVSSFLSRDGTREQYEAGLSKELLTRISPDIWTLDWERMSRPGNVDMQFELNCDFKSNLDMYPTFQKYFRTYQPQTLVIWGKHDVFFNVEEASCYRRDLPSAHIHILDGGHKALETNFNEVVDLINKFFDEV